MTPQERTALADQIITEMESESANHLAFMVARVHIRQAIERALERAENQSQQTSQRKEGLETCESGREDKAFSTPADVHIQEKHQLGKLVPSNTICKNCGETEDKHNQVINPPIKYCVVNKQVFLGRTFKPNQEVKG